MATTVELGTSSDEVSRSVAVVSNSDVPRVWPRALEVIRQHKTGLLDRYTEANVLQELISNRWQLWVGIADGEVELVGITRYEEYTTESVFRLLYVGGELMKFMPGALTTIEQFASFVGAHYVAYDTRESIVRLLRRYNYFVHTYEMRKSVKVLWSSTYGS